MAAASISAPRSEGKLIAAVLWERCRLGMRGLSFQRRTVDQVSPAVLARIDLLEDLRLATNGHDALRSVLFSTQSLRLALDAGEPTRIARALSTAAVLAAGMGTPRGAAASQDMLARADALVTELGSTRERMELSVARAAALLYEGRFLDVLEPAAEVERALRELPPDSPDATYYFKFATHAVRLAALSQLDWRRFRRELLEARQEAQDTENVNATLMLAVNEVISDEIAGQADASIARLDFQSTLLPRERFTMLHILHMTAVMYAACATGEHAWGFDRVARYWEPYLRSALGRTVILRSMVHTSHARLMLNECVRSGTDPSSQPQLMKDVKAVARAANNQNRRLLARIAYLQGDHTRALELLRVSVEAYTNVGWEPEALRDRYAIGRVTGGEQGEQMAREALATLEEKFGCHDAQRDARAYFPELADPT
jgi:hypothetical protein